MSDNKKIFLLDAMALIYRAHYAFISNPRRTTTGLNTSAVFGFTTTLLDIQAKEKPTHMAIAFDTEAPTQRHIEFEAYKANRQEQPEDITLAIPMVRRLAAAMRIPIVELDGFEADDVVGTMAKEAEKRGFEVFMMTPDKDYCQLVTEKVKVYKPSYQGKPVEILGIKEVLEKWEIQNVDQVRDILGLQGDAVDNIPGIPGIGEKTAKKLIAEFGTVENLVANADQLKGKMRENVLQFGEQGIFSKKLATIITDVPIPFNEEDYLLDGVNEEELKALFQELEFRTLGTRLFGSVAALSGTAPEIKAPKAAAPKVVQAQMSLFEATEEVATLPDTEEVQQFKTIGTTDHFYWLCDTEAKIKDLANYLPKLKSFCFDTETDGTDAFEAELVGMSFAWQAHKAYYLPVPANKEEAQKIVDLLKPVLENPEIEKVGQNLKYDMLVLKKYGVEVQGPLFDTMLAHYLIEPEKRHGMDAMAEQLLGYKPVSITSLIGKKGKNQGNMRDVNLAEIAEYAAEDADITWQLKEKLAPFISTQKLDDLLYNVEGKLAHVLTQMEYEGVRIDTEVLGELSEKLALEAKEMEQEVFKIAGEEFNLNSAQQLGKILFDKLKLDPKAKKTKTGQYATGEEVLSKLAEEHPIVGSILEYRELQKLKSTYIDALPELISPRDGRVHTSFNQAVAATGRLSSTNPNLQNIPIRTARGREIRKAFIPRSEEFTLLSADYSQIELRIMAEFSGDETMIQAFREGKDIHSITASRLYKVPLEQVDSDMRRKAKTANFGIIYGISAFGLSQRLNIPRKEAAEIIDAYFREFAAVKDYMDAVINQAREYEYVATILGRRRFLPNINSRNQTDRGFAERNAINTPIQGSAADMIKKAMVNIAQWMKEEKLKSKLVLQVHDELVFDAHLSEVELLKERVPEFMKVAIPLKVPMEVGLGTGPNWLEAH